jgi:hypothetical protein
VGYSIFSENTKNNLAKNGNKKTLWIKKKANEYAAKRINELSSFNNEDYIKKFGEFWCNVFLYEILALLTVMNYLKNDVNYNYGDTLNEITEIVIEKYENYFKRFNVEFNNELLSFID